MELENIIWQWNENQLDNIANHNGFQLTYVYDEISYYGKIEGTDASGNVINVWDRRELFADSAALLIENEILFVGLYSHGSTGCNVLALNLSSFHTLWEKQIKGLGSMGHSRYSNKVQLSMINKKLVVFGWESGGKYIEILDPASGDLELTRNF